MHPDTVKRLAEMDKRRQESGGMTQLVEMIKQMAPKEREKPKTCSGCGRTEPKDGSGEI